MRCCHEDAACVYAMMRCLLPFRRVAARHRAPLRIFCLFYAAATRDYAMRMIFTCRYFLP